MAREGAPTLTVTAWGIGGSIGQMATPRGVMSHSVLSLTGVSTNDGVAGASPSGGGRNECLGETNSLARHSRYHQEVILGRLSRLEYLLKHLPLMGCVKGLDNAMIGKVAMEADEKTRVKAIDKTSTHADRILPLAQKQTRSVHELLVIGFNRAGDGVAVLVSVHLADVL